MEETLLAENREGPVLAPARDASSNRVVGRQRPKKQRGLPPLVQGDTALVVHDAAEQEPPPIEGTNPLCDPIPPANVPRVSREEKLSNPNVKFIELPTEEFHGHTVSKLLAALCRDNCANDTASLSWFKGGTYPFRSDTSWTPSFANPVIDTGTVLPKIGEDGRQIGKIFNDTSIFYMLVSGNMINAAHTASGMPRIKGVRRDATQDERDGNSFVTSLRDKVLGRLPEAFRSGDVKYANIHLHSTKEIAYLTKELKRYIDDVEEGEIDAGSRPEMELALQKYQWELGILARIQHETRLAKAGESTISHLKVHGRTDDLLEEPSNEKFYMVSFRCDLSNCYAEEIRELIKSGAFKRVGAYISEFDISVDYACYCDHTALLHELVDVKKTARLQKDFGKFGERLGITRGSRIKREAKMRAKALERVRAQQALGRQTTVEEQMDPPEEPAPERITSQNMRSMLDSPWYHVDDAVRAMYQHQYQGNVRHHQWDPAVEMHRRFTVLDNAEFIGAQCISLMYQSSSKFGPQDNRISMALRCKPHYNKDTAQFEHASNANKVEPGSHHLGQAVGMFNRTQRAACTDACINKGHSRTEATLYFVGMEPDKAHLYMYDSYEHMYQTLMEWQTIVPLHCIVECPRATVFKNYTDNMQHVLVVVDSRTDYAHLVYSFNSQTKFIAGSVIKNYSKKYKFILESCGWGARPIDVITLHRGGIATRTAEELARDEAEEENTRRANEMDANRRRTHTVLQNSVLPGQSLISNFLNPRPTEPTEDVEMESPKLQQAVQVSIETARAEAIATTLPTQAEVQANRAAVSSSSSAAPSSKALGKRPMTVDSAPAPTVGISDKALGKRKAPVVEVDAEEEEEETPPDLDNAGWRDSSPREENVSGVPEEEEEGYILPEFAAKVAENKKDDAASTVDYTAPIDAGIIVGWISPKEAGGAILTVERFVAMPTSIEQIGRDPDGKPTFMPETRIVQGDKHTGFVPPRSAAQVEAERRRRVARQAAQRGEELEDEDRDPLPVRATRRTASQIASAEQEAADWEPRPGWNKDNSHIDDAGERPLRELTTKDIAELRFSKSAMDKDDSVRFAIYPSVPLVNSSRKKVNRAVQLPTVLPLSVKGIVNAAFKKRLVPTRRSRASSTPLHLDTEARKKQKLNLLSGVSVGFEDRISSLLDSFATAPVERDAQLTYALRFAETASTKDRLFEIGKGFGRGRGAQSSTLIVGEYELIGVLLLPYIAKFNADGTEKPVKQRYSFFLRNEAKEVSLVAPPTAVSDAFHMWTPDLYPLLNQMASPQIQRLDFHCYLSPFVNGLEFHPIGTVVCHEKVSNRHGREEAVLTVDVTNPSGDGMLRIANSGNGTRSFNADVAKEEQEKIVQNEIHAACAASASTSDAGASSVATVRLLQQQLLPCTNRAAIVPVDSRPELVRLPDVVVPLKPAQTEFTSPGSLFSSIMDKKQLVVFKVLNLNALESKVRSKTGYGAKVQLEFPADKAISKSRATPRINTCLFDSAKGENPKEDDIKLLADIKRVSITNDTFIVTKATKNAFAAELVPREDVWWKRIELAQPTSVDSAYYELQELSKNMPNAPENGSIIVTAIKSIRRTETSSPLIIKSSTGTIYKFATPNHIGLDFARVKLPCKFNVSAWRLEGIRAATEEHADEESADEEEEDANDAPME